MITYKQQKFMLKLFVIKKMNTEDAMSCFTNESDFFHQIQPLKEIGFLENRKLSSGTQYRLTKIGSIFTNLLCLLDKDFEDYIKHGYLLYLP